MGEPPVIVLGMHRSGSSMIVNALEYLGLFVGCRKDPNHEARFFTKLNDWMLRQANASWDNPMRFKLLERFHIDNIKRVLRMHMSGVRRIEFLGLYKSLRYKDIRSLDFPWGWKDPRNTFTIDIWNELFPNAKIPPPRVAASSAYPPVKVSPSSEILPVLPDLIIILNSHQSPNYSIVFQILTQSY